MDLESDSTFPEAVLVPDHPNSPKLLLSPASLHVSTSKPTFKRIADLYFPDGNIILEAGMTHFRVFRSVMAARSPVFKDVLSLPQPKQDSGEGKVDGCDIVRLSGDDPEDVACFLRAIFDSSFFESPPSMTTLPTIAGILRLSTKYEVTYLRRRALRHLDTLYPTSLACFRKRAEARTTPRQHGTAFFVAALGREFGLDWLMPSVLYCMSGASVEMIMNGTVWDENEREAQEREGGKKMVKLVEQDRLRCLQAQRELWVRERRDILQFLTVDSVTGCRSPEECRRKKLQKLRTLDRATTETDWVVMDEYQEWFDQNICKICAREGRRVYDEEMERFWDALPGIFGLKDWPTLEKLKKAERGDS